MFATLALSFVLSATPFADALSRVNASTFISSEQPLLIERVPSKKKRVAVKLCMGFNAFGQIADAVTTSWALGSGNFQEIGPLGKFMHDPLHITYVKSGMAVGTTMIYLHTAKKSPVLTAIVSCATGAVGTWTAQRNANNIIRARK